MKNKYIQSSVLTMLCVFCSIVIAGAQKNYTVAVSKNNNMKLSGTSSMHDWEMNAVTFTSDAQFEINGNQQITRLNSLSFTLPSTNLKSDKKGLDENAYGALKVKKNKNILYKLTSATVAPKKDNAFLISTKGNLTIAGVTKEVSMDVHCVTNKDATISCSGSEKLNMTDYKVTPPSFMFGAMKTGEKVTLDFMLVYMN